MAKKAGFGYEKDVIMEDYYSVNRLSLGSEDSLTPKVTLLPDCTHSQKIG